MQHHWHDELPSSPAPTGAPSVPTALVVDDSFGARARVTMLLELGGWRVHQAVGTEDALRLAALIEPDLVVTEMVMRNGHGATLMRRLREQGSTARFLVVASRRTHQCLALATAAGALACLLKPVDPRLFVDVMRGLAPAAAPAPAQDTATGPAAEAWGHTEEGSSARCPTACRPSRSPLRPGTPRPSRSLPTRWPSPRTASGTPRSPSWRRRSPGTRDAARCRTDDWSRSWICARDWTPAASSPARPDAQPDSAPRSAPRSLRCSRGCRQAATRR
jgi:CheY-like chemotaxis protein